MFVLMVDIRVKPQAREAFVAAISENAAASNQEPGCLQFDVSQDGEDADRFYLYEVYREEADLDAHRETAHFKKYAALAADLMAEPPSRRTGRMVYSPLLG